MGQALYRKYRSRGWDELVGQQFVAATLKNAVESGNFGHAYLFSGPRGTGKTSVARILARQINKLDYTSDEPHIDIIEIDAASNTSVEDIRDLKEKVSVAPALAKYKIYIIDEVHMLSKSAFNALLKTLEEPPAHVIFILATTDPQKLPKTIISRTQHFAFQPIAAELATEHLLAIAKSENIELEPAAASLIAELGEGGLRDSESLLDQLAASGQKITRELVEALAGLPPHQLISDLTQAVDSHNSRQVVKLLGSARLAGYQAGALAKKLSQLWRSEALETASTAKLSLIRQMLEVAGSPKPDQLLEIILLEASLAGTAANKPQPDPTPANKATPKQPNLARRAPASQPEITEKNQADEVHKEPKSEPGKVTTKPASPVKNLSADKLWASLLEQIRQDHHTLYGMARMAKPSLTGDTLTLEFAYSFHLKKLAEAKNLSIISAIINNLTGRELAINCHLNTELAESETTLVEREPTVDPPLTAPAEPADADSGLKTINSIFGGSELLQSD